MRARIYIIFTLLQDFIPRGLQQFTLNLKICQLLMRCTRVLKHRSYFQSVYTSAYLYAQ